MVLSKIISTVFLIFYSQSILAFALLSSHDEARLPVSHSQPTIVFELTTQAPDLKGKSLFLNGAYANHNEEDFWVALVEEAVSRWNDVPGSYVDIRLDRNFDTVMDSYLFHFLVMMIFLTSNVTENRR